MEILKSFWLWASMVVVVVLWLLAVVSAGRSRGGLFLLIAMLGSVGFLLGWVPVARAQYTEAVLASVPTAEPITVEKIVTREVEKRVEVRVPYTVTVTSPITVTVPYTVEVPASLVLTDTAWVKELVSAPASVVWMPCSSEKGQCASWNTFANGDGKPVAMKVLVCPMPQGARLIDGEEVDGEVPVGKWQILGITVRPCPKPVPSAPAAKPAVAPAKFDPLSVVKLKDGVKLNWQACPEEPFNCWSWKAGRDNGGVPVWASLACYQDGTQNVNGIEVIPAGLSVGAHEVVTGITVRPCK